MVQNRSATQENLHPQTKKAMCKTRLEVALKEVVSEVARKLFDTNKEALEKALEKALEECVSENVSIRHEIGRSYYRLARGRNKSLLPNGPNDMEQEHIRAGLKYIPINNDPEIVKMAMILKV